ncbi:MAG: hypothetical protein KDA21_01930 [Phycisphaerales bacterium]|nr:hypothetical protein [Phycisphaerales bacterium]
MTRPDIEILLTPSRLVVALARGSRLRSTVITHLDRNQWDDAWAGGFKGLDEPLQAALAELGVTRARARVFYRSPAALSETFAAPGRGSAALSAARLALADSAPFDLRENPSAVAPLMTWKEGRGARTLMLLAADSGEFVAGLEAWLTRHGCEIKGAVPLDAAGTIAALDTIRRIRSEVPVVCLRLGEHGSTLSCMTGQRLDFLRPVQIDIHLLVEALTRPIQPRDQRTEVVTLDAWEATSLLFRVGVPAGDDLIDEQRGLHGYDILPALQPALQRCAVEAKQSLRFSLGEEQRRAAVFVITGPGASIPNLQPLMAGQLGLGELAAPDRPTTAFDPFESGTAGGDLWDAQRLTPASLGLLPLAVKQERGRGRVRNLMAAGTALAVVTGGGEAWLTWTDLQQTRADLHEIRAEVGAREEQREQLEETQLRMGALRAVEREIHTLSGVQPAWDAVLSELSLLTPVNVDLVSIEAVNDRGENRSVVWISGYFIEGSGDAAAASLASWVHQLQASPLFADAMLGTTQRAVLGERTAQHFEIELSILPIPEQLAAAAEVSP